MKPNIFDFATSELSQDAMICWLLEWAKPENKASSSDLHSVGVSLLNQIYNKAKRQAPELKQVEVQRQVSSIDIFCVVDKEVAIIIEDKAGTNQHSDQLARYRDYVIEKRGFAIENIILIYLQTGDQSDYTEVVGDGYAVLDRVDLLWTLESTMARKAWGESDILNSFALYLRRIEDDVKSYLTLPIQNWSGNSWKGFYMWLQTALGDGGWGYVSNRSGGFLGFWWHSRKNDHCKIYLQLEQDKFCLKMIPAEGEDRRALGNEWSLRLIKSCHEQGLNAARPSRIRGGSYMTVAVLEGGFRKAKSDELIDLSCTLDVLRAAERAVDESFKFEA